MTTRGEHCYLFPYIPAERRARSERTSTPWFYICLVLIAAMLLLGYLALQTSIAQVNFALEQKQKQVDQLKRENRTLALSIAEKTNLRVIEQRAREELGMVRPENQRFVHIDPVPIQESIQREVYVKQIDIRSMVDELTAWLRERATVAAGALAE